MLPSIKCPIMRHVMRPLMRWSAVGSSGQVFPVEKIEWRLAELGGHLVAIRQIGGGPVFPVGKIGRRAGNQVQRPVAARPGSCQARWPQARPARRRQALSTLTLCGLDPVDPARIDPAHGKTQRDRLGLS
jgi:hypothetical protein